MNGYTSERVKSSEGTTVLDCGCAYTPARYLQMCDPHYQPWHQRHEQARFDHAKQEAAR